jgi:hypothetical protein
LAEGVERGGLMLEGVLLWLEHGWLVKACGWFVELKLLLLGLLRGECVESWRFVLGEGVELLGLILRLEGVLLGLESALLW